MPNLYRITPLEKKSVEYYVDVFERLPNGTIRGFEVTEYWRWGQGWREEDEPVWKFEVEDGAHCRPDVGWGCELDDLCGVYVNFSDGFTEEEKAEITAILQWEQEDEDGRCGTARLYDGDHNWEIEDDHVRILPPFRTDLCDENGDVIQEDIEPYDPDNDPKLSKRINWPNPD